MTDHEKAFVSLAFGCSGKKNPNISSRCYSIFALSKKLVGFRILVIVAINSYRTKPSQLYSRSEAVPLSSLSSSSSSLLIFQYSSEAAER